jgi:hypothetical protein
MLLVSICALTIYAIWKFLVPKDPGALLSQAGNASIRSSALNEEKLAESARSPLASSTLNANSLVAQSGVQLGLFDQSIRTLINSKSLARIDYALYRIGPQCMSVTYNSNGVKPIEDNFSASTIRSFGEKAFNFGRATNTARYAAYVRSIEKCSKLYEAARVTQQEFDALKSRPEGKEYAALQEKLFVFGTPQDYEAPQLKEAVGKVVSEPMFGLLSRLLLSHLEYESLNNAYTNKVQPNAFPDIVTTLVLCRMGDDCGQSGIVTEQLCWLNAICGFRAEDAIMANLIERGIDVTALNEFVSRVHSALQTQDTSIFRKPKK